MIDLKKINYFTGDKISISSGVYQIVKYLELCGRNCLLLTLSKNSDKYKSTPNSLKYLIDNQIIYEDFEDFVEIINSKSSLFRVDLLICDFWHLSKEDVSLYRRELEKLNIQSFIVSKEYLYKNTDDITDYHIRVESKSYFKSDYIIYDNINKSTTTLDNLVKSYIRDKKIDGLFGESDN